VSVPAAPPHWIKHCLLFAKLKVLQVRGNQENRISHAREAFILSFFTHTKAQYADNEMLQRGQLELLCLQREYF
jgi:hypothetical protein